MRLSVLNAHRRRGIATQLVQHCVRVASDQGLSEIVAFTEPHWTDAVGFYAGAGFELYGSDSVDVHLRLRIGRD